jgi:hypothetical protein
MAFDWPSKGRRRHDHSAQPCVSVDKCAVSLDDPQVELGHREAEKQHVAGSVLTAGIFELQPCYAAQMLRDGQVAQPISGRAGPSHACCLQGAEDQPHTVKAGSGLATEQPERRPCKLHRRFGEQSALLAQLELVG